MATALELETARNLALLWASRGFKVFPVGISWDDRKGLTNKRPLNGGRGHLDGSTDPEQIESWFRAINNRDGEVLGVGLVPGSAGYIVFDCDRHGFDGVGFADSIGLPPGWCVDTASGGEHRYLRKPTGKMFGNRVPLQWANLIDVRADSGWVVAPGVVTPWGSWDDRDPWDPPEVLPAKFVDMLQSVVDGVAGRASGIRRALKESDRVNLPLLTVDAIDVMVEQYHVHHVMLDTGGGDEPYVLFTREGKREGVSGTIGYTGEGEVYVFSSSMDLPTNRPLSIGELTGGSWTDGLIGPKAEKPKVKAPESSGLKVIRASTIQPSAATWLWEGRLAKGTLGILAGKEGTGKSSIGYWASAAITRGTLLGADYGTPKSVIIIATEDSWEHVVVPRLMANNANLDLVLHVEAVSVDMEGDTHIEELMLPRDVNKTEALIRQEDVSFIFFDPLISRLTASLDSHRDGEVRRALEPMTKMLGATDAAALGIMHFNKSGGDDILNSVMASKAFTAVARSVHAVIHHPLDHTHRIFGTVKNNLGPSDTLPRHEFTITAATVLDSEGNKLPTAKVKWGADFNGTMREAMQASNTDGEALMDANDAVDFLSRFLQEQGDPGKGGWVASSLVMEHALEMGIKKGAVHSARKRLGVQHRRTDGFPSITEWRLKGHDTLDGLVKSKD